MLWQGVMMMHVVCTAIKDHAEVLVSVDREDHVSIVPHASDKCNGKDTTFAMVLMTTDSQLGKSNIEGFCDKPYSHPNQNVTT